ncbi:unnamed protein product [Parnassius apollo]|uniref:(apollo) hypothetical protein n=1 Tax=Parnassius apollo TaxID=110799 RepID=A0A8S3W349_PARAO|nr:unnamed protein product [Parnassius apollo]
MDAQSQRVARWLEETDEEEENDLEDLPSSEDEEDCCLEERHDSESEQESDVGEQIIPDTPSALQPLSESSSDEDVPLANLRIYKSKSGLEWQATPYRTSYCGYFTYKKKEFVMNYAENNSDLERELFAESDSDEIYYPDYDEEELSSEDDCQPPTSFSVTDISLRSPVQKLPQSSPSQSPPHHQDDDQTTDKPSAEESTSHWTSEEEKGFLKSLGSPTPDDDQLHTEIGPDSRS